MFEETTSSNNTEAEYKVDQIFILQLIGFYLLLDSLINFFHSGSILYYIDIQLAEELGPTYHPTLSSQNIFALIKTSLKLIIGISFVFKPNVWSKVFNRLRNLGLANK